MRHVTANINMLIKHYTDEFISFLSGDILTTILTCLYLQNMDWLHPFLKLILTLIVGIIGGAGGLLGKDLYVWFKKKLWK